MLIRKYIYNLFLLTLALCIGGWIGPLVGQAAAASALVSVGVANIRSAPTSTNNNIVGTVYKDTSVEIISQSGEWYQVQFGKISGWMHQSVLNATPISVVIPTASAAPVAAVASAVKIPNITLDGQTMNFEVAPRVENNRVLVPLRAVFEAMGATVAWDQATQTATAVRGNTTVVLPLNSTSPTVDARVWPLDVPAQVVQQRILAPLRFVGEALGGTAAWDGTNYAVILTSPPQTTDVTRVTVSESTVNLRSGPATTFGIVTTASYGESLPVLGIQNGWYQVSRGGSRVWVAGYVVNAAGSTDVAPPIVPNPPPVISPDPGPAPQPAPVVVGLNISSQRTVDGLKIIMESAQKLETDLSKNPGQVTYEFADRQIVGTASLQENLGASLLTVSGTNSGSSAVVQIVFPATLQYSTSTENDGKREVFTVPNFISEVNRTTFGSSGENITVNAISPIQYTSNPTSTKLEIVFGSTLLGNAQSSYTYDSPLISSVTFKTQTVGDKPGTVMTITTSKAAKFSVGLSNYDCSLNILFIDQNSIQSRLPLVVLDAGHGGRDPGASGDVLAEKDINLQIVLKAGQLLTANGVQVAYTRLDDSYVSLEERPAIANLYNAALFVSVHNNANDSSAPNGTETYCYYPLDDPLLYMQKDERYNLALRLQQALVAKLGRFDRGVKQGNLAVLRETTMPSALIETAFLSNPEEEALLGQAWFIDQAAQAICDGISGYMRDYL